MGEEMQRRDFIKIIADFATSAMSAIPSNSDRKVGIAYASAAG
jgi:hypothetical protein